VVERTVSMDSAEAPRRAVYLAPDRARLARSHRRRRYLTAYWFIAPSLLMFVAFLLIPVIWVFKMSFYRGSFFSAQQFAGLGNWRGIFSDPIAIAAMKNTFIYAAGATASVVILGMAIALLLQRARVLNRVTRSLIYLPVLAPMLVASLTWSFVVHPDFGILAWLLAQFGLPPVNWLGDHALLSITMLEVWRGTGFYALLFLAGLVGLPKELYHAAELDGAIRQ